MLWFGDEPCDGSARVWDVDEFVRHIDGPISWARFPVLAAWKALHKALIDGAVEIRQPQDGGGFSGVCPASCLPAPCASPLKYAAGEDGLVHALCLWLAKWIHRGDEKQLLHARRYGAIKSLFMSGCSSNYQ